MKELFEQILHALERGENVVLCSILARPALPPEAGGAPEDGRCSRTAPRSGPSAAARSSALRSSRRWSFSGRGASYCQAFCLAPNQVNDIGMICGGTVMVYFRFFDHCSPQDAALVRAILELLQSGQDAWLVSRMEQGKITAMGTFDETQGLRFAQLDEQMLCPWLTSSAVYQKGEPSYYVEPISRAGRVYIFGGGHVGRALVPVLANVGFRVTVFDNREDFARQENYPAAEQVIFGDYYHIEEKVHITPRDYVVIMTPGHQADREVLLQAMKTPACYVGCIGSRHKIAATNQYLMDNGVEEAELSRIHAPIGITIFAETPEEIAISIAAELIRCRAQLAGTEKARKG